MSTSVVLVVDPQVVAFPFLCEPENIDNWPSVKASEQFVENLVAIVERGFVGVRVRTGERGDAAL